MEKEKSPTLFSSRLPEKEEERKEKEKEKEKKREERVRVLGAELPGAKREAAFN